MKHVFVSLLMIAIGAFGLINADNIRAVYADLFPDFTVKAQALDVCASGINFTQPGAVERSSCSTQAKIASPAAPINAPREDARRHFAVQR